MADILRDELLNDPLTRGYSAMTDKAAADDLKTEYRTRNRVIMTASEVFNSIDQTEFDALSNANEAKIWNVLHLGDINPFGLEASIFISIFPGGGSTLTALNNDRKESISRAVELGIRVGEGLVAVARA